MDSLMLLPKEDRKNKTNNYLKYVQKEVSLKGRQAVIKSKRNFIMGSVSIIFPSLTLYLR